MVHSMHCRKLSMWDEKQGYRPPSPNPAPMPNFSLLTPCWSPDALGSVLHLHASAWTRTRLGTPASLCLPGPLTFFGPCLPSGELSSPNPPRNMRWPSGGFSWTSLPIHSLTNSFIHSSLNCPLMCWHLIDDGSWGVWAQSSPAPCSAFCTGTGTHLMDKWFKKTLLNSNSFSCETNDFS